MTRNSLAILCAFVSLWLTSSAQTTFQKTYGESSTAAGDAAVSIVQTSDDGFLIASTRYNAIGFESIFLIRTNSAGDTIWTRFINEANMRYNASSMIETMDDNFVVTGYKSNGPDFIPFLVKFDSLGNILWNKSYDWLSNARFFTVIQCPDSGYIMGGIHIYDALFVRTDESGDTIWSRLYSASNYAFTIYSIAAVNDGGFVSCGYSGLGMTPDAMLMKIDSAGNFLWAKSYGGSYFDYASQVIALPDSSFMVAATAYSFSTGLNDGDFFLLKTDSEGNLDWCKIYASSDSSEDICRAVNQYPDGSFLFSGSSKNFLTGFPVSYLIRTDASGDTLWTEVLNGGNGNEIDASALTTDGGFAMTGLYYYNDAHVFVVKADAAGYFGCNESPHTTVLKNSTVQINSIAMTMTPIQPTLNSYLLNSTSGADVNLLCMHTETPEEILKSDIEIFPNPVTEKFTIGTMQHSIYSVDIFNLLGKKMYTEVAVDNRKLTVDCTLFPKGIYFVKVETEFGAFVQKLLKQ